MWSAIVAGPVIQVTVPSVSDPASFNMTGASAATRTGGGVTPLTSSGAIVMVFSVSPSKETCSPRSSGRSTDRYSRMCRAGFS